MFRVGIIGRPNVGKSTFFNKVVGHNKAITSDIAGTTRDSVTEEVVWNDKIFELVDMGGLDASLKDEMTQAIAAYIKRHIKGFDLLLFMVDAQTLVTATDLDNLKLLRQYDVPTWLVVNKADNERLAADSTDFYRLGFKDYYLISSTQGANIAELLDDIAEQVDESASDHAETKAVKVAIIGRPNVGKSSILNAVLGSERAQVSPVAGTTRDAIDTTIEYENEEILLIDTAGLRRPGKIKPRSLEQYSVFRAEYAIERCDIAIVVLDITEGITSQDQHIIAAALENYKGLIIAANKWDLAKSKNYTKNSFMKYAVHTLDYLSWATFVYTSAVTGEGIDQLLKQALAISRRQMEQIPEADLDLWLKATIHKHPMLGSWHGKPVKLFSVEQVRTKPPTFIFRVNEPKGVHFSTRRYLENKLREAFDYTGTAVRFIFKKKR